MFPLAGVPGFHGLARTALVGLKGPGSAVLDVYCQCTDRGPITSIVVRLRAPAPDEFTFSELGGGKIAITPALDTQSVYGHFATEAVWQTAPDGWERIGPINAAKIKAVRKALKPAKVVAATKKGIAATEIGSEPPCECGDALGFHDPCSKCECPKYRPIKKGAKAARYKKRK